MTKPVKVFGDYVVCFNAGEEDISARKHFTKDCGWTAGQFAKIARFAWFCAEVSLWKDGEELACEYLGACSYKTSEEFYTRYAGDYFADMVLTCADTVGDEALTAAIKAWREQLAR